MNEKKEATGPASIDEIVEIALLLFDEDIDADDEDLVDAIKDALGDTSAPQLIGNLKKLPPEFVASVTKRIDGGDAYRAALAYLAVASDKV